MKYKPQEKYDKVNCYHLALKFNKKTDQKIIDMLEKSENKQGLVKSALLHYKADRPDTSGGRAADEK